MKKMKGFTLIELLLVIAIIAILTAVIMANLTQARAKSRDTKRISDISQIQLALAMYLNRIGRYPSTLPELTTPIKFMATIPKDPKDQEYGYVTDADGTTYCLGATLETTNTIIGTSDSCSTSDTNNNYKVKK